VGDPSRAVNYARLGAVDRDTFWRPRARWRLGTRGARWERLARSRYALRTWRLLRDCDRHLRGQRLALRQLLPAVHVEL